MIYKCSLFTKCPFEIRKVFKKYKTFKDTHREKSPQIKTPALTKNMCVDIWVIGTSKHVFIRGS